MLHVELISYRLDNRAKIIQPLQSYLPECHVVEKTANDDKLILDISFYWMYKNKASPVLKYLIFDQADNNEEEQVTALLTLHAFCKAILLPSWCVAVEQSQGVHAIVKELSGPNFTPKSNVITQGLRLLKQTPAIQIDALMWESIFFVCNAQYTRSEIAKNVPDSSKDNLMQGMATWEKECEAELIKGQVTQFGDVFAT